MAEIGANFIVQPFQITVQQDQPGLVISPDPTNINIVSTGYAQPEGNVGELQYNFNGQRFAGASNTNVSNGNVYFQNLPNLKIAGGSNAQFLQTDGTGNLVWAPGTVNANSGNGIPVGANTQIQITDGTGNFVSAPGFTFDNASNLFTAPGNASIGDLLFANRANIGAGNVLIYANGDANFAGNVYANNFIGDVIGDISNGNSNIRIFANSNIAMSVAGNANILVITGTGANVTGTLDATGNVSGGNITTTGVVNAIGNVSGGNLTTAGVVAATGNVSGGNITTAGAVAATGNISGGNLTTTGLVSATGNVTGGNVNATAKVVASTLESNVATGTAPFVVASTTKVANLNADLLDGFNSDVANTGNTIALRDANGNISANYFIGNGAFLTGILVDTIYNGNSNVKVYPNSNVTVSVTGNSNVTVFTDTGINTNNVAANNANITNILGNTGNFTGNVTANYFIGNGAFLTGIDTSLISNGNSNVRVFANSNVTISVTGNANVLTVTNTGANITGYLNSNSIITTDITLNNDNIHLGSNAGSNSQGANSIAIGPNTGITQGFQSVAIGTQAGQTQGDESIAIGYLAGYQSQANYTIAIGLQAGRNNQSATAIAIGKEAAQNNQSLSAIAIGENSGTNAQGNLAIAIGYQAGRETQGSNSIAIGAVTGNYLNSISANNSILLNATGLPVSANTANAFFVKPIRNSTTANILFYNNTTGEITYGLDPPASTSIANGTSNVNIPIANGEVTISVDSISNVVVVSNNSANIKGNINANGNITAIRFISNVATGTAPFTVSSTTEVANLRAANATYAGYAGFVAGNTQSNITAVGTLTDLRVQNSQLHIGANAGLTNQNGTAIAIGAEAGTSNQSFYAIALGQNAGSISQANNAVAIGLAAGNSNQGANSVAIGAYAGQTNLPANTIILNGTGSTFTATSGNALYIKPIAAGSNNNVLMYNTGTGQITYNTLQSYTGYLKTISTTVGALDNPITRGAGARAFITDSNVAATGNFGNLVYGGGANNVPIYSDGTSWRIG